MGSVFRFWLLSIVKVLSRIFFSFETKWIGDRQSKPFKNIRLGLLLNHTSLFELVYCAVLPFSFLWRMSRKALIPGADVTLNRTFAGSFFKIIFAKAITITRKRDETWDNFLQSVQEDSMVLMAPEGRMKRPTGLDKFGKPMTVRGGVADILERINSGDVLIGYSGGLHHVQAPGQKFPRLFKKLRINFEVLPIAVYKEQIQNKSKEGDFRKTVIRDLESRRDQYCPS